ncbi:hypothetical protein O3G_MSEX009867 [Manduca sexta]|uniref:Uncharacterized protein n=1 Tax=Manduca sexta TaxID=7130 RepID=A0A922CSX5_MANSE|nr:hypothetical protein O3G_MSEX009867 [Manduca sexta]
MILTLLLHEERSMNFIQQENKFRPYLPKSLNILREDINLKAKFIKLFHEIGFRFIKMKSNRRIPCEHKGVSRSGECAVREPLAICARPFYCSHIYGAKPFNKLAKVGTHIRKKL